MRPSLALAASLVAAPCLVGAAVMAASGAPPSRSLVQLAAVLVGASLAALARRVEAPPYAALVALALVAGTRLAGGLDGVHRWYALGPLRLHASALVAPWLVVTAARHASSKPLRAQALLAVLGALHVAQPDAGQSTAVCAAALVLTARAWGGAARVVLALSHLSLLAAAWTRPDPLAPVAFVEDAVARAFALHPAVGSLALLTLAGAALAPRVVPVEAGSRPRGDALVAYGFGALAATAFGAFPVPGLGFGASPIVGALLALGALATPPAVASRR